MVFFSLSEKRFFRSGDGWVQDGVQVAVAKLGARGLWFGIEEDEPLVILVSNIPCTLSTLS